MSKPTWAAETHIGHHRQLNEDRYTAFECPLGQVFVVCDGMGGHEAGEVAATIATQTIQEILSQATPDYTPDYWLRRSLHAAHAAVQQAPQKGLGSPQMGTTAVILLISPQNEAWWAHIGDSRLYLYRRGKLHPLTRDHSLVAWYVEAGFITPAAAYQHPQSNQLLLSIGGSKDIFLIEAPPIPLPIQPSDLFLLCSDGLSAYVPETIIAQILSTSQPLSEKAKALVHAALSQGGYDNITVLLASPTARSSPSHKRLPYLAGIALLATGIAILAGLGAFYLSEKSSSPSPETTADSTRTHFPTSSPSDSTIPDTTRKDTTSPRSSQNPQPTLSAPPKTSN